LDDEITLSDTIAQVDHWWAQGSALNSPIML